MLEVDKNFAGSIPENYDRYMVPLIFQPYAEDLVKRVMALSPNAVLETAAGSGVVTRALAAKLQEGATYVATDLNQAMVDYAATQQASDLRIKWQQANALALPSKDESFDVVICQFGAMFFPDRIAGFREARRVLKPGGHFLFNVWDKIEENIFANDVTDALANLFPKDPPRFLARTPHGYHDVALIRSQLQEAGFTQVKIDTITAQSQAPSAHIAAFAYCQGTPLRNEIEARTKDGLDAITEVVAAALVRTHGDGEISAKIQAHVMSAMA